jgi:hypothetical protein
MQADDQPPKVHSTSLVRAAIDVKNFVAHGKCNTRVIAIVLITLLLSWIILSALSSPLSFQTAPAQPAHAIPPSSVHSNASAPSRATPLPPAATIVNAHSRAASGGVTGLIDTFTSGSPLMQSMLLALVGSLVYYLKDIFSSFRSMFMSLYSDSFATQSSYHLRSQDANFDNVYKYVCNCCVPRETMLAVRGESVRHWGLNRSAEGDELGRLAALQRKQPSVNEYSYVDMRLDFEKKPGEMTSLPDPKLALTMKFLYSPCVPPSLSDFL